MHFYVRRHADFFYFCMLNFSGGSFERIYECFLAAIKNTY